MLNRRIIGLLLLLCTIRVMAQTDSVQVAEPAALPDTLQAAEPTAMPDTMQVADQPADAKAKPEPPKPQVYQATSIRVDILNPVYELIRSKGHTYSVEIAANVRLLNRLFPTLELGYAGGFEQDKNATTPVYNGRGEFMRLGLDINPLKKRPDAPSYMTVGLRAGAAVQHLSTPALLLESPKGETITDAWGEVVAGVHVNIAAGFNMGWAVRLKFLFTTNSHGVNTTPNYIPGYGFHDTMNWGFNYYLGYTF